LQTEVLVVEVAVVIHQVLLQEQAVMVQMV
jgi:hypothetical protein